MEMESSRGSFERLSQPGLKKPRLSEEPLVRNNNSNGRATVQRQAATAALGPNRAGSTRFRVINDRDSESSGSGGYQPQPVQHQELISQYKTALAELTFNSKPIITNLTIIAGENVNAAKAIAATICNNIIEVPSDQKLPSLYLLDSIVKNIGRYYIKYFAARLPEVFCKAYKQVDPATHPGMRHLFGTWKGVFPLQSLQMIEKELGFLPPAADVSLLGTNTSKPDSHSQRPAHSIHVNPKYLVARQQLQSKAKGPGNDVNVNIGNEDGEKLERTTTISSGRSRADPRLKMLSIQQSQRDVVSEPIRENNIGVTYGDFEYNSDVSRQSDVNFGKASKRVTEQGFDKSRYGAGNNSTETVSSPLNGFDTKLGLSNNPAAKYLNADAKLQPMHNLASRSSSGLTKSWKNSEEEEYMWEDINSRLTNHGSASSSRRDPRLPAESERLVGVKKDFGNHIQKPQGTHDIASRADRETSCDSLSTEQKNQATFVHHVSSPWSQEPCTNTLQGQQRPNFGGTTPSRQSIIPQLPPSPSFACNPNQLLPNVTEQEHPSSQLLPNSELKATRSHGQFNGSTHSQASQDSLQVLPQNAHSNNSQRLQLHNLRTPPSIRPPFDPRRHNSFLQPLQSETLQSEPFLLPQIPVTGKPLTSLKSSADHLKPNTSDIPGYSSTSSMLAAVMSSGILGSKSVNGSLPELNFKSEAGAQPQQPSRPSATQFASSGAKDSSSSLYSPSSHEISSLSSLPLRKTDKPPLLPGLPTSLVGSTSASASSASNPVSSLLSTLVAKGLISASKGESLSQTSTETLSKSLKGVTSAITVSSASVSSALPPLSTSDEVQLSVPAAKSSTALLQSTKSEIKSVVGFEFKPDVIRKTHPAVISELTDDLPHQCSICGLRFKLQERYDRHIEWHTSRSSELNSSNRLSRRWYANSVEWVTGKAVQQSSSESMDLNEGSETELEISTEQTVPADESQCVCILCGEVFKDFYSQEKDEWMFEGAVYLIKSLDGKAGNISEDATNGPIVHANCISESSLPDLGLVNDVQGKKGYIAISVEHPRLSL